MPFFFQASNKLIGTGAKTTWMLNLCFLAKVQISEKTFEFFVGMTMGRSALFNMSFNTWACTLASEANKIVSGTLCPIGNFTGVGDKTEIIFVPIRPSKCIKEMEGALRFSPRYTSI